MRIVNRCHHVKIERLHRGLHSVRTELLVDAGQIRPERAAVWKRKTRNAMTRRARRAPVVEVNLACEKRFSNVWRARWQHFAGNGSGMGGRLRRFASGPGLEKRSRRATR